MVTGQIIHREPVPYLRIARQGSSPAAGRVAEDQVKLLLERKLRRIQNAKANSQTRQILLHGLEPRRADVTGSDGSSWIALCQDSRLTARRGTAIQDFLAAPS